MDQKVLIVSNDLKVNDLALLVLIKPHGEDEGTLSVSLTPFAGLSVVERKSKGSFSKLTHAVKPKQCVNFFIGESEKGVNIFDGAKIESNCVSSAFLITGRDRTELCVPNFTSLIARFERFTSDRVSVSAL